MNQPPSVPGPGEQPPMAANPRLDDLARLASRLLDAPIAMVAMLDDGLQWVAGSVGVRPGKAPGPESFCATVIREPDQILVVPDATKDPRFHERPSVLGDMHLRFYAGAAIRDAEGTPVGALVVADREPRDGLDEDGHDSLCTLATQAGLLLRLTAQARALDTEHRFLAAVLDNLQEGVVACDADGRITVTNAAAGELRALGAPSGPAYEEWAEHYTLFDADGQQLPTDRIPLVRAYHGERLRDVEFAMTLHHGQYRILRCNGQPIRAEDDRLLGAVVTMRDVTDERAAEAALRERAERDALTGLYNRPSFEERLRQALPEGDATNDFGVLFLDLDDFKVVNDTYGHAVGDQLLKVAAQRLLGVVKDGDIVARMGGDEFVVLCRDVTRDELNAVRERVEESLRQPFVLASGVRIAPRASVGMAHIDAVGGEATVVELADRDMYRRKRPGRTEPE